MISLSGFELVYSRCVPLLTKLVRYDATSVKLHQHVQDVQNGKSKDFARLRDHCL